MKKESYVTKPFIPQYANGNSLLQSSALDNEFQYQNLQSTNEVRTKFRYFQFQKTGAQC